LSSGAGPVVDGTDFRVNDCHQLENLYQSVDNQRIGLNQVIGNLGHLQLDIRSLGFPSVSRFARNGGTK